MRVRTLFLSLVFWDTSPQFSNPLPASTSKATREWFARSITSCPISLFSFNWSHPEPHVSFFAWRMAFFVRWYHRGSIFFSLAQVKEGPRHVKFLWPRNFEPMLSSPWLRLTPGRTTYNHGLRIKKPIGKKTLWWQTTITIGLFPCSMANAQPFPFHVCFYDISMPGC